MNVPNQYYEFFYEFIARYTSAFYPIGCIFLGFTIFILALKVIKMCIPHNRGVKDD